MSYRNLAIDAISKMMGYDPFLPKTEAMVHAYAEALERAKMDDPDDVLEGVARMYEELGDPGWRPTPRALVRATQQCWRERIFNSRDEEIEDKPKVSFGEFRQRHPDVKFPKFGRDVR